jgi:predicted dehydrogenase
MNRDRIRVGLIGVGRHGARYAQHLVHDLPMASLQAVCRRHPEQGLQLSGADSVKVYGEAQALIADPSVDVIVVVTPPLYALEVCRLAVQARKPLLIEKPLATTAVDAKTMVALARDARIPLMTAQTLRFDRTIQHLKSLQSSLGHSQELNLVFQIEIRKTAPDHVVGYGKRGALLEIGVHMLDLVRFLTGEEAQTVCCTMDHIPPIAPERMASIQLTTTGGTICRIEITRVVGERAGRAIWAGSQGRVEADWMRRQIHYEPVAGAKTEDIDILPSLTVLDTLSAFLQAVSDGTPMPITGEDGCRAVEIAEACYQSAQLGGALISVDREAWNVFRL